MERVRIDSRSIIEAEFDPANRTLLLVFADGSQYRYREASEEVFRGLLTARSKGRYFNEHIRFRLPFERLRAASPGKATPGE